MKFPLNYSTYNYQYKQLKIPCANGFKQKTKTFLMKSGDNPLEVINCKTN